MSSPFIASTLAGRVLGSEENSFVIAEWQDPGGTSSPPRLIAPFHVHHNDDEAWYVLEGALRIRLGTEEVEAPTGSAVFALRGTPHTYWNPGPGRVRYLLIMSPNIHKLIQSIHAMPDRNRAALEDVFQKYDSELLNVE